MGQLEQQMRHRDREMVPRILVQGMFALMLASTALVAWAQWSGAPEVGVLVEAPVVESREVVLWGDRTGIYRVETPDGAFVTDSASDKAGFIGVMGRVIDRERMRHDLTVNPPVQVVRRANGHIAVLDPATGMAVELIGYGADNVAAFARLLD